MAIFQAVGLPMIDATEWPIRPEDTDWQGRVVDLLAANGADPDHVNRVKQDLGAARFRPEEVGGAAAHDPWPAKFQDASPFAQKILKCLTELANKDEVVPGEDQNPQH